MKRPMKIVYRQIFVLTSLALVFFCSWRGIGNMLIGFWLALIVVGIGDVFNMLETKQDKPE